MRPPIQLLKIKYEEFESLLQEVEDPASAFEIHEMMRKYNEAIKRLEA